MPANAAAQESSADPALFLRLAANADLAALKRHPALKALKPLRWRKSRQTLRLLDSAEASLHAAGWLCAAIDDAPLLLPLQTPSPAPPAIGDLGALQILARGALTSQSCTLPFGKLHWHEAELQGRPYRALQIEGPRPQSLALAIALGADIDCAWDGAHPLLVLAQQLGLFAARPLWANQIALDLPQDAAELAAVDALQACGAMLRHCLTQLDGNIACLRDARDSEGVHQMRVALRRLRSVLALHKTLLPSAELDAARLDLAWLNEPLGRRRDLDVFVEETLTPLRRALPDLAALDDLQILLDERRQAAQRALLSAFESARFARLRLALEHLSHTRPHDMQAGDATPPPALRHAALLLRRRRRKLKKLGARLDGLNEPDLHELRILAKKLRYAVEFYRPFFARPGKMAGKTSGKASVKAHLRALAALQDALGALNDAAVGNDLLRNLLGQPAEDPAAAAIAGWFAARQHDQLASLPAAWAAYARLKPFWKHALPAD